MFSHNLIVYIDYFMLIMLYFLKLLVVTLNVNKYRS